MTLYEYETEVPGAVAGPSPGPLSRREEARRDRLITARIEREAAEARARMRIEADREWEASRTRARQARADRRQRARQARAERLAGRAAWLREHTIDLLFVPVIAVPAALAWTAMAAYGASVYGPPGVALPALSEGAMWAFAGATTITRRRHPHRPVWHLRAGTVIFAAYGAVLNFLHGMSTAGGPHGPVVGVSMALVSVAGVTAHQLVTAGPRRTRAERDAARLGRAAARRELAARRAAVRHALIDLDENGTATLLYQPGTARLGRRRGRTRLVRARAPDDELRADPSPNDDPHSADPDGEVPDPPAPVHRAAVVAEIAEDFRGAIEGNDRWRPDYPALMERTGYGRRWCEKVVQDAKLLVLGGSADAGNDTRTLPARPDTRADPAASRAGRAPHDPGERADELAPADPS
jgi:hypothetical protein